MIIIIYSEIYNDSYQLSIFRSREDKKSYFFSCFHRTNEVKHSSIVPVTP